MWEGAKSLGADLDGLAEDVYNRCVTNNVDEETTQLILNVLAEVRNYLEFLKDEKVDRETLNKVKIDFKNHRHADGQVVLPMG